MHVLNVEKHMNKNLPENSGNESCLWVVWWSTPANNKGCETYLNQVPTTKRKNLSAFRIKTYQKFLALTPHDNRGPLLKFNPRTCTLHMNNAYRISNQHQFLNLDSVRFLKNLKLRQQNLQQNTIILILLTTVISKVNINNGKVS